jgi:tetratricopeptide (TPR) repeat protein
VEPQVLPHAGACLDALEGAVTEVRGVEKGAGLACEDEALILPEPGQVHPLFELALAVIQAAEYYERGGRYWESHGYYEDAEDSFWLSYREARKLESSPLKGASLVGLGRVAEAEKKMVRALHMYNLSDMEYRAAKAILRKRGKDAAAEELAKRIDEVSVRWDNVLVSIQSDEKQ